MPPPRATSADPKQTPAQIAAAITSFLEDHPAAAILEDGRVLFDLTTASHELLTTPTRCTLHLWSSEITSSGGAGNVGNIARRILSATPRNNTLRLSTQRFGQSQPTLLELIPNRLTSTPTTRDTARKRYLRTLERVLTRNFPDHKPDAFRTAMDLEQSFGPAYARGSLLRGSHAFAVIAVSEHESQTTIDGILTLGILWLHHCREHAAGRRLYHGLRIIVPQGTAQLTHARLAWLNTQAAQWQLYELDTTTEELTERDPADHGNIRSRLIHHPDETAALEGPTARFAEAIAQIHSLLPTEDHARIELRLRSTTHLAFLLHGLEFARARSLPTPNAFTQTIALTLGTAPNETPLTPANRNELQDTLADLFNRRRAFLPPQDFGRRGTSQRIGSAALTNAAHSRLNLRTRPLAQHQNPTQDPLYRAAPERWLESVLRQNLAPLTRSLAPTPSVPSQNACDPELDSAMWVSPSSAGQSTTIPRLNPQHVYSQVPAIAGASDRGLLDLLGVTADGRLAVIELKTNDDLHFALQGLDYWIRVRHHHIQPTAPNGQSDFHRHGYFRNIQISPHDPRLYLVAPALHIHPATETILRYLSPRVEWHLLALDERWRRQIRVVWRKQSHN